MKLTTANKLRQQGFTLIEMIGVLAVIAILAAVLIPKVFEAINNARINNAAMTCQSVKTAVADHYAKFGSLGSSNSVVLTVYPEPLYDIILMKEGFVDKPFSTKIGVVTNAVYLVSVGAAPAALTPSSGTFDLDGDTVLDTGANTFVVEAHINGATEQDAKDLNDRIDGPALGTAIGTADTKGRVKYANGSPTIIYVYLTHR